MSQTPRVSVIVPSLDGRDLLAECLPSLAAQSYPRDRFEVVVVDNGSTDGTPEWLAAEYPDVVMVRLEENLGFAEGSNRGAGVARGEFLVFLNNDMVADRRLLEELVRCATGADAADCVAARILDRSGQEVEFGGASVSVFGFGSQRSSWQPGFREAGDRQPLPFACGGAMLIRAELFRGMGGFDAGYFAYYEDVDLGWRLGLAGHRIVYARAAEVRHRRHATGERFSTTWRHFHWYRNALLTLVKNSEEEMLPRLLPYAFLLFFQRIGALYGDAARAFAGGDAERARFLLASAVGAADGIGWVLSNMDDVARKRRSVQALRKVTDRELAERFEVSLDFGPEAGVSENAMVAGLLPFLDLSTLMTPERAGAAAMAAASRIAKEAAAAIERMQPELVAWHAEATRLGRDLHERNLEAARLHGDLHERNLEVDRLHRDLHARNLAVTEMEERLAVERSKVARVLASREPLSRMLLRRLSALVRGSSPD